MVQIYNKKTKVKQSSYNYISNSDNNSSILYKPIYQPYVVINSNIPYFSEGEKSTQTFEKYSNLDYLGRCGVAFVNVFKDTLPTKNVLRLEW